MDYIAGNGERLVKKLEGLNLGGMMMKRKDSVFAFMRCRDWLKMTTIAGKIMMQKRSKPGPKNNSLIKHAEFFDLLN